MNPDQRTPQRPLSTGFGPHTTAAEVLTGVDLTGRLAIVTGGYSGIGLETTRALVAAGAQVVAPARRPAAAVEALGGLDRVEVAALDLGDLEVSTSSRTRSWPPAVRSTS